MQRRLLVEFNTEAENKIQIGPVIIFENQEIKPEPLLDMAILCEAVCTMIHLCHNEKIKDQVASLTDCINHLKKGFIDETYKTDLIKFEDNKEVKTEDLIKVCELIGSIFFYGNFKAETANERELEALLRKIGYFFGSEEELLKKIHKAS
jgi:superoxide dismutase